MSFITPTTGNPPLYPKPSALPQGDRIVRNSRIMPNIDWHVVRTLTSSGHAQFWAYPATRLKSRSALAGFRVQENGFYIVLALDKFSVVCGF